MPAFVCRLAIKANDPDQVLPNKFLPDYVDETSGLPDHQNEWTESEVNTSKQGALDKDARPELFEFELWERWQKITVGT